MKKVSKKFEVESCDYRIFKKRYPFQPEGTRLLYYEYDESTDSYCGVLAYKLNVGYCIMLLASLCMLVYTFYFNKYTAQSITCPTSIECNKGRLALNVNSDLINGDDVIIRLSYKDEILYQQKLDAGKSITTVPITTRLSSGDYQVTLEVLNLSITKSLASTSILMKVR